jgi:hypothetical protein
LGRYAGFIIGNGNLDEEWVRFFEF